MPESSDQMLKGIKSITSSYTSNRTLVHDGPLGSLTSNSALFNGFTICSVEPLVIFLINPT